MPHWLHFAEKTNFAGILIAGILYGTPTYLFLELSLIYPFDQASSSPSSSNAWAL